MTFDGDFETEDRSVFSSWEYINPRTEMNPHTEYSSTSMHSARVMPEYRDYDPYIS